MISDEQLDEYRVNNIKIRVVRDQDEANDVKGIVVAWNEDTVLVRKQNRKVLKLSRSYHYQPFDEERRFGE